MPITQADQFAIEILQHERIALGLQPFATNDINSSVAERHTAWMDANDRIDHSEGGTTDIVRKFNDAGYDWGTGKFAVGENEQYGAGNPGNMEEQILRLHVGYNNSPSHEAARHSSGYNAVGIDIRVGDLPGYGRAFFSAEEFSFMNNGPYAVGVAFLDANGNGNYNIGEGRAGVELKFTPVLGDGKLGRSGTAVTSDSGGYSVALPAGNYIVQARLPSAAPSTPTSVRISKTNIKVDVIFADSSQAPYLTCYGV